MSEHSDNESDSESGSNTTWSDIAERARAVKTTEQTETKRPESKTTRGRGGQARGRGGMVRGTRPETKPHPSQLIIDGQNLKLVAQATELAKVRANFDALQSKYFEVEEALKKLEAEKEAKARQKAKQREQKTKTAVCQSPEKTTL